MLHGIMYCCVKPYYLVPKAWKKGGMKELREALAPKFCEGERREDVERGEVLQ